MQTSTHGGGIGRRHLCRGGFTRGLVQLTAALLLGVGVFGCESSGASVVDESNGEAIARVLAEDALLGHQRNIATMTVSMTEASRGYAEALEALDFRGVPGEFRVAFLEHADAWRAFAGVVDKHAGVDLFRLEMHDAIERMQAESETVAEDMARSLERVWATWGEVDEIAEGYGVVVE